MYIQQALLITIAIGANLVEILSRRWIGRRGAVDYPPWCSDVTPIKYGLDLLREHIEISCAVMISERLQNTVFLQDIISGCFDWLHQFQQNNIPK